MKTIVTSESRTGFSISMLSTYSGLLRYLSLRDVFVRYKQTRLGFGWSVVRPVINVAIFGVISWLIDREGDFWHRFVTVSCGIVFWQLLTTVATDTSNALSANSGILTKVYFPKILLPLSTLLVACVDFSIAFALFLVIFFVSGGAVSASLLALPLFIALGVLFSFSLGTAAATASVRFRDVKFILPFLLQVLFYLSPVFLSSEFVLSLHAPAWMKVAYQLNPLVFIINGFKFAFFSRFESFDPLYAVLSVAAVFIMLLLSVRYFSRAERTFADFI